MKQLNRKDLRLKFLVKRLLREYGYGAELEVQVADKSYAEQFRREQYTDIDVLAFKFDSDLFPLMIAAECKSGEESSLSELLKLEGIIRTKNLYRGYFVKTKIHQNARNIAAGLNIVALSESELIELMQSLSISTEKCLPQETAIFAKLQQSNNKSKEKLRKLYEYITFESWNIEPWRSIHNILHLLSRYAKEIETSDIDQVIFCHRVLLHFTIHLLNLCFEVTKSGWSDPLRSFMIALYGGPRNRRDREALFDKVNTLLPSLEKKNFDPEFARPLAEIVARIIKRPIIASNMPLFLYDFINNSFYPDGVKVDRKLLNQFQDLTRKYIQDVIQFLVNYTKIDKKIFAGIASY